MLDNCCYNKIKIMHNLSCLIWFIEKHAVEDAQKANDSVCVDFLKKLKADLYEQQHELKHMLCEETVCPECK